MEPAVEIEMVRENLALALALWAGTRKGIITAQHLPTGRTMVPTDEGSLAQVFNPLELKDDRDLTRCVSNQVRGAVTFSAVHSHRTMMRVYGSSPLQDPDSDMLAARCAIYLLNHTLGQRMLSPLWSCPVAYRRRFEVRPISFVLDASDLDGKPVFWQDFGGLEKYLELLEFCVSRLKERPAGPARASKTAAKEPPASANQLAMGLPAGDPVAAFVAAACVVGPEARIIARGLYDGYLEWCRESGSTPLVQRSFGMRMTRLGFVRKRRGKGRHWWEGIQLGESAVS